MAHGLAENEERELHGLSPLDPTTMVVIDAYTHNLTTDTQKT